MGTAGWSPPRPAPAWSSHSGMDHAATVADLRESAGAGRGDALALRWRDVDLDAGRLQVRRSLGVVTAKGAGQQLVEGPTNRLGTRGGHRRRHGRRPAGPPRDSRFPHARARAGRRARAGPSRRHARPPRAVRAAVRRPGRAGAHGAGGGETPGNPAARPPAHPRHPCYVPVEVVFERLGHASATITLTAHQHVHLVMGREAADRVAALLEG